MASHRSLRIALGLTCGIWLCAPAAQADDLSCQDRIISLGDSTFEVRSLCGTPDGVEHRVELRSVRRPANLPCRVGNGIGRCPAILEDSVEIRIDEWTYDFGPQRFMRFLTFEQGKLVDVQTGNYGHKGS